MLFNSIEFLVFFVLLFFLYWNIAKNSLKLQNYILLFGGYIFYGWSDWRLLSYLIIASAINYYVGIQIEKTVEIKHRQRWLTLGLIQGIGGLVFFKYFNFFIISFKDAFHLFGISLNVNTLNIIIPIGISFFTFKTISYLLDINKGKLEACKDWIAFFTYVSFFPTILSGPIDKARDFIPQLIKKREFNYENTMLGLRNIFWGLFKKVVVANYLGTMADDIFKGYSHFNSITLFVGTMVYIVEMYADFSGYSEMAIGIGKLLGFDVTPNFNYPFFAENIADFWRRWHISLTSWLTEYVFTPLSITCRDLGQWGLILAIVINFTIIGIWHGANWTFLLFGFLHGCYYIPLILNGTFNKRKKVTHASFFQQFLQILHIIGTFLLVSLTLVLFKSPTIFDAICYYKRIINLNFVNPAEVLHYHFKNALLILILFLFSDWARFKFNYSNTFKLIIYLISGVLILASMGSKSSFIYFQF